ncbi:MAG: hypothetical protein NT154_05205 [Verrucomicrobia bacterium]|nr:hypothetical protein [Verrucomicrobiota bacterium]
MARANQGRDNCADDRDRKLWPETLGEACEKTGWRIHAWVMGNGGIGLVAVSAHHGAAAVGEPAVGGGRRIPSDADHWPGEARAATGIAAAEKATGAGL